MILIQRPSLRSEEAREEDRWQDGKREKEQAKKRTMNGKHQAVDAPTDRVTLEAVLPVVDWSR